MFLDLNQLNLAHTPLTFFEGYEWNLLNHIRSITYHTM